jgi:acyl-CoA synthetase (AMP-forming)/AMP-acid ligase II
MPDSNIILTFLEAVANNREQPALIQDGKRITYVELESEIVSAAHYYQSRGIRHGDMVLVFVPMSLSLYKVVLALFYIGACPVFLDEWVSVARLKECLKVVPCRAMIARPGMLILSWFVGPLRRITIRLSPGNVSSTAEETQPTAVNGSDTALVTFTTGSTGVPKAANRTHDYLSEQLKALLPLLNDVASPCLTLLPIVVLLHLASGNTAVLPPGRFKASKPATIRHLELAIATLAPRSIIASPAIVSMLIDAASESANEPLQKSMANIRTVITGGGPVYPDLAARMIRMFPIAAITAVYGSTEAEPISHITGQELAMASTDLLLTKGLPAGKTEGKAEVGILDLHADWHAIVDEATLYHHINPRNTPGEVIVAGPHVLRHYINNPAAEAETKLYLDGKVWHRTGDCALMDDEGKIFLLGRVNEIFTWKRKSWYPATTTYALQKMAGIKACALLLKDELPVIILEQQDKHLVSQVRAALLKIGLEGATIRFVPKIPKDPRHQTKVDYALLKDQVLRGK